MFAVLQLVKSIAARPQNAKCKVLWDFHGLCSRVSRATLYQSYDFTAQNDCLLSFLLHVASLQCWPLTLPCDPVFHHWWWRALDKIMVLCNAAWALPGYELCLAVWAQLEIGISSNRYSAHWLNIGAATTASLSLLPLKAIRFNNVITIVDCSVTD